MARFLSSAWFAEVSRRQPGPADPAEPAGGPAGSGHGERLVLRQVVRDTPEGDVCYHVVVGPGGARISPPGSEPGIPDLTITTSWETAVAIAQGKLASQAALVEGRMRVKGNLSTIAGAAAYLSGIDPVPAEVREGTTY